MAEATKAQIEALRWLIARGLTENIDSAALHVYYREKTGSTAWVQRTVAWKRISGANMARMCRDGLLRHHSFAGDRITYSITDKGREAAGGDDD
jgi:hypothetical protein